MIHQQNFGKPCSQTNPYQDISSNLYCHHQRDDHHEGDRCHCHCHEHYDCPRDHTGSQDRPYHQHIITIILFILDLFHDPLYQTYII